jgi:hypothetical protein
LTNIPLIPAKAGIQVDGLAARFRGDERKGYRPSLLML